MVFQLEAELPELWVTICESLSAVEILGGLGLVSRLGSQAARESLRARFLAWETLRRRLTEPLPEMCREDLGLATIGDVLCGGEVPFCLGASFCAAVEGKLGKRRVAASRSAIYREVCLRLRTTNEMKVCAAGISGVVQMSVTRLQQPGRPPPPAVSNLEPPCVRALTLAIDPKYGCVAVADARIVDECANLFADDDDKGSSFADFADPTFYDDEIDGGGPQAHTVVIGDRAELPRIDGDLEQRRKMFLAKCLKRDKLVLVALARALKALDADERAVAVARKVAASRVKRGNYEEALRLYRAATCVRPDSTLFANLALVALKIGANHAAAEYARQALALDETNVKAKHRRATALLEIGFSFDISPEDRGEEEDLLLLSNNVKSSRAFDGLRARWRAAPPRLATWDDCERAYEELVDLPPSSVRGNEDLRIVGEYAAAAFRNNREKDDGRAKARAAHAAGARCGNVDLLLCYYRVLDHRDDQNAIELCLLRARGGLISSGGDLDEEPRDALYERAKGHGRTLRAANLLSDSLLFAYFAYVCAGDAEDVAERLVEIAQYGQREFFLSGAVPTWKITSDLFWATSLMQTSHKLRLALIDSMNETQTMTRHADGRVTFTPHPRPAPAP
mmetsp:Transcript_16238/g.52856  ORF Transcript_16238/g.52856 Transcript_16238/m.52856 type:complete len:624 (+) Transcript_16238:54-1925(+)